MNTSDHNKKLISDGKTATKNNNNAIIAIEEDYDYSNEQYRPNRECMVLSYSQPDQDLILPQNGSINRYIARNLIDHQVEGIKWLWGKYCASKGGILG